MICVEVAVSRVTAHAFDLDPGEAGLGADQLLRQCFASFADLQQADTDRTDYQGVSFHVRADRVNSCWISVSRAATGSAQHHQVTFGADSLCSTV
jgi:hypothetical protein